MGFRYEVTGKRLGIFVAVIVAVAMVAFITETISARTDKSPQHIYQVEMANTRHTGSTG
jgi:hypothetical protein